MIQHEYPTTPEEFDKYASGMPVVNDVTAKEDGYKLYAEKGLASPVKFKMTDNGDISVVIMQPEKVLCYTCELDFKTDKHPEKCPVCGKSIYDILDTNRKFQNEWNDHQIEVDKEFKARLVKDQVAMLVKHGMLKEEEAQEETDRLTAIHVPQ